MKFTNGLIRLILVILFFSNFIIINQNVDAASVSIATDKKTYYYGDYLTITIQVSEVINDVAFLYIIDDSGKQSSPIPFPISELKNSQTSPFPFEKEVYPQGNYTLRVQYSGNETSTEFYLKDSGKIVIPVWIKDVSKMWIDDLITSEQYTTAIEYLIRQNIITIPLNQLANSGNERDVPQWVKTNTKWWIEGNISDNDYALGLEHLVKIGVIKIKNNNSQ